MQILLTRPAFLLISLMLLNSCTNKHTKPSESENRSISYVDSILKYDTGGSINIVCRNWFDTSDDGAMYITNVNKIRTAVIAFDNRALCCYIKTDNKWKLSDSIKIEQFPYEMWLTDLNGDGFDDIRMCYPVMRGNNVCTVLLYQPQRHAFRHNSHYDQMNIGYDPATKLVRVSGLGGLYDNVKELYKITGDSIAFYRSVEMSISTTDSIGELRYYENVNGKKTEVKIIKENCSKVAEDFGNEYWSDDLNYFSKGNLL